MSSWKTKPGNSERGWNDPPMFIYGSGAGTNLSSTRKNVLSKRVAYPMNDSPSYMPAYDQSNFYNPNQYAQTQGHYYHAEPATLIPGTPVTTNNFHLLPPSSYSQPPSYHGPVVVPTMPVVGAAPQYDPGFGSGGGQYRDPGFVRPVEPERPHMATDPMSELPVAAVMDDSDLQVPNFADDEQMYHYCVTRLQRALNECRTTTEERLLSEMQKKLNIFSEMWKSAKISYVVKSTMARLATAVHRRKYSVANDLHLVLMMDHVSEVSRWLVGIKKLVQEVEKAPQQPTSPSVSCCYGETVESTHDPRQNVVGSGFLPTGDFNSVVGDRPPVDLNGNLVPQLADDFGNFSFYQEVAGQESNGIDVRMPGIDQYSPEIHHSSPTFDAITRCFDGHGEFMMKFSGGNEGDANVSAQEGGDGFPSADPTLPARSEATPPASQEEIEGSSSGMPLERGQLCDIPLDGDDICKNGRLQEGESLGSGIENGN